MELQRRRWTDQLLHSWRQSRELADGAVERQHDLAGLIRNGDIGARVESAGGHRARSCIRSERRGDGRQLGYGDVQSGGAPETIAIHGTARLELGERGADVEPVDYRQSVRRQVPGDVDHQSALLTEIPAVDGETIGFSLPFGPQSHGPLAQRLDKGGVQSNLDGTRRDGGGAEARSVKVEAKVRLPCGTGGDERCSRAPP